MKSVTMLAGCAVVASLIGTLTVRAEEDLAVMKAQLQEVLQRIGERDRAIEALPAVAAAKQAADAASAARQQFEKENAAYVALVKARADARVAYDKGVTDALEKDEAYAAARKQLSELEAKDNELRDKLKAASPEQRPALETEVASSHAQKDPLGRTLDERRKAVEGQPEVVALKKTADDARAAREDYKTSNPEYLKMVAAEKDARAAYEKAKDDAKTADAERTALRQKRDDLQGKINAAQSQTR